MSAGFDQIFDYNKYIISKEGDHVYRQDDTEWHSENDIVLDGDNLLEDGLMDQIIKGGESEDNSSIGGMFGGGRNGSPRDINYLLTNVKMEDDFSGWIFFFGWHERNISFGKVGEVNVGVGIPDYCLVTGPLSEGGLLLFPESDYPRPVIDYTYNEVADSQYWKTYKCHVAVSVTQYGKTFSASCDLTFHVTKPTKSENIQTAKKMRLM